jgi:hypothetical protein
MPLQLGGVETERPKIITYDPENRDELAEVDKELRRFTKQGFRIDVNHHEPGEYRLLPPAKADHIGVMRILSQNGDDRLTWDRNNPGEIKDAFKKFKDFIKKGYQAFAVLATGKKGHKLDDFDPLMEEIIMVPATVPG